MAGLMISRVIAAGVGSGIGFSFGAIIWLRISQPIFPIWFAWLVLAMMLLVTTGAAYAKATESPRGAGE